MFMDCEYNQKLCEEFCFYGGGERGAQGSGGETWGKDTIAETQTQMGG